MTEHHIHIHLSSQGTQAAQEVVADRQAINPAPTPAEVGALAAVTHRRITAILMGALIGREKGELSQETAQEIAADIGSQITLLVLEKEGSEDDTIDAAYIAAGYLMHGSGHYKKSTIAQRASDAIDLI
jgi:hypothetical protein